MAAMQDLIVECGYEEMSSLERPFKPQAIYPASHANQNPGTGKASHAEKASTSLKAAAAAAASQSVPAAVPLQDNESKPHVQEVVDEAKVEEQNDGEVKANDNIDD